MSINIPEYYKSFFSSQGSMLDVQRNLLSDKNAINLKDASSNETYKQINTGNIDLSTKTFPVLKGPCVEKLITIDNYGNPIDYYKFEKCVDDMKDLSKEQISTLRNAIITSTESVKCSQMTSDTYGMRICQTNVELKFISKNIIPEKYQDQFNSIVDQYTKDLSNKYISSLEDTAKDLINTKSSALIKAGWRERGKEMQDSLKNGTYIYQTTEKIYSNLYKKMDISSTSDVKEKLDSVFNDFIANGQFYTKGSSTKEACVNEVKYLSEKWNAVMDEMKTYNNFKFKTSINSFC